MSSTPLLLAIPEIAARPPAAPYPFGWLLLAAALVVFMQAGFALLETGMGRAKNAAHTMSMNFLAYALSLTGFFVCGFALMCGGTDDAARAAAPHFAAPLPMLDRLVAIPAAGNRHWGLFGLRGFFANGAGAAPAEAAWFLFAAVCVGVACTIPTG